MDSTIKIDDKEVEANPNSTKETNLTKEEMEEDTTDQNLDLVLTVEEMIEDEIILTEESIIETDPETPETIEEITSKVKANMTSDGVPKTKGITVEMTEGTIKEYLTLVR